MYEMKYPDDYDSGIHGVYEDEFDRNEEFDKLVEREDEFYTYRKTSAIMEKALN